VKASKKIHVTQPALSKQLKLLELDLGKKLFDRIGRRLVLNNDGIAVKDYATKIFRYSEEMLQFLKSDSKELVKIIKIGVIPWISKSEVYDFIRPILTNQHIKVEIFQKDLASLIDEIKDSQLDIILCDSSYSHRSKRITAHHLKDEPIVCVSSYNGPIKGKFPSCLKNKKIITYSEASSMSEKIDKYLNQNKINPKVVASLNDSELIKITIEKTTAFGFIPLGLAKNSIKNKDLRKLGTLEGVKFSMWAITRSNYSRDGIIARIIKKSIDDHK
jgi:LysR family transcriptional activator of nhaA